MTISIDASDIIRVFRGRPLDPVLDAVLMFGPANLLFQRCRQAARMIYLDPPFGTGKPFYLSPYHKPGAGLTLADRLAYDDPIMPDGEFQRTYAELFEAVPSALTNDGVVVVQLDSNRAAYARIALDRVFGQDRFWGEWVVKAGISRDGLIPHTAGSFTPTHNTLQISGRLPADEAVHTPEQRATLENSLWLDLDTRGHESGYPSEKSAALASRLLETLTDPGQLVLEGFAGSAALSLVALRSGRRAAMAELSPRAIGIAWNRLLAWADQAGGNVAMCLAPGMDPAALVKRRDTVDSREALDKRLIRALAQAGQGARAYLQDAGRALHAADVTVSSLAAIVAAEIMTDRSEIVRIELSSPSRGNQP